MYASLPLFHVVVVSDDDERVVWVVPHPHMVQYPLIENPIVVVLMMWRRDQVVMDVLIPANSKIQVMLYVVRELDLVTLALGEILVVTPMWNMRSCRDRVVEHQPTDQTNSTCVSVTGQHPST